jgi:hypothetical protein
MPDRMRTQCRRHPAAVAALLAACMALASGAGLLLGLDLAAPVVRYRRSLAA